MSARPPDLLDSGPQIHVLIQIRELFLVYLILACSRLLAGSGLFKNNNKSESVYLLLRRSSPAGCCSWTANVESFPKSKLPHPLIERSGSTPAIWCGNQSKVNRWEYLPIPFIYLQSRKLPHPKKKDRTEIHKTSLCLAVLHSPYLLSFSLHQLVELLVLVFNPLEFRVLFMFLSPPDPPLLSPPVPPFRLHENHQILHHHHLHTISAAFQTSPYSNVELPKVFHALWFD